METLLPQCWRPSCLVGHLLIFFDRCLIRNTDASTATTLRREMLDVIRHKFLNLNSVDDLHWPLITPNGSPVPPSSRPKPASRFSNSLLSDDEEPMDDVDLKAYWESVAKRYEAQCLTHRRCPRVKQTHFPRTGPLSMSASRRTGTRCSSPDSVLARSRSSSAYL